MGRAVQLLCLVTWFGVPCVFSAELRVARCGGSGMDVTVSGPFQGLFTVKDTKCQIEVRLMDTNPIMFFIPYGEKCGVRVDKYGRAISNMLVTEQKDDNPKGNAYYEAKEITLICRYFITADPSNGLEMRRNLLPFEEKLYARNFFPVEFYESPVLSITNS